MKGVRSFAVRALLAGAVTIVMGVAAGGATAQAVKPPPVEAFAGPAFGTGVQLSPSGTHVSYFAPVNGERHLIIASLQRGSSEKPVIIPPGKFQFGWAEWVNDRTLIFQLVGLDSYDSVGLSRRAPARFARLGAVERDGSNLRVLYEPKLDTARLLGSTGSIIQFIDDETVMIAAPDDREQIVGKLNVYTGRLERVDRIRTTGLGLLPDPSGKMRLASRVMRNDNTTRYLFRDGPQSEFKEISRSVLDQEEGFVPLGFGKDDTLYVASDHETGFGQVYKFNLATLTFGEKVLSDPKVDVGSPILQRGAVVGISYTRDLPVNVWFDPAIQRLQEAIDKAVPESTEVIADQTPDGRFSVVFSFDPIRPTAIMIYDRQTKELNPFSDTFPDIPQEAIGPRSVVSYQARDGLTIPAYLTLPPGKGNRNLPFVVLPHGGPAARDNLAFDQLAGFLASRGYAVLQPQFRGSAGFGRKFLEAGRGEWGAKMQTDVTDGVRWAVDQGIADPNRMCIVGWSYGGYSALMGAVQDSNLYKCAIAVAPVTNLDRLWRELPFSIFSAEFSRAFFFQGQKEGLTNVSPVHQVARINIPTLIIHGDMDVQVYVQHARDMVDALRANGKPHEYIEIKGMDHSPRNAEEMIKVFTAWERFLAQHIGS